MAEKIVGIVPHKSNNQQLNDLATKIFTVGGVDITTNLQPKKEFSGRTPTYSQLYTLDELPPENELFKGKKLNGELELSYDKRNPKYFAKYGSLLELVRVSIDDIILKFPASIRCKDNVIGRVGNNINGAGYFPFDNTMTFAANVSYFSNPFNVYFLDNENFEFSDERVNPIRNLSQNYHKYEIVVDGTSYEILEFTPATRTSNDFVRFKVKGKPFDIGNNSKEFYIKPLESEISSFYKNLDEFEAYLINPDNDYTAVFNDRKEVDGGIVINYRLKLQFPKIDEYNLDITTRNYTVYLNDLTEFASKYDDTQGNLFMRKLVPENVQSVTLEDPNSEFPTFGQINKLLIVYGRQVDEINKHIENIKFFNNVTYDKRDNIPEALIPIFAKNLGWDVDVPEDIDENLWRYLIINTAFIAKSKGTRNAIEFILNYLSIPNEIVDFNEYVFRARRPIDVDLLELYYSFLDGEFDINSLPIDSQGYPVYPSDTPEDYFQIAGESDNGMRYFYKFLNLMPDNFSGTSVNFTGENVTLETLFEQDFNGSGNTLGYDIVDDELATNLCYDSSGSTITDPYPETILDICGCPLPISDKALEVCASSVDLTGCTPIILDVYYDCVSETEALLYINVLGGTSPYTITGLGGDIITDGFVSGETVTPNTYTISATDVNGCSSEDTEFTVECLDPCLGTTIDVTLGYTCLLDIYGQNTGEAEVSLSVVGGTPPYTIVGVQDGDIVSHNEVITVEVTDSQGCSSGLVGDTVDCEPPEEVDCDPIELNATLETTSSQSNLNTATVNVTYQLLGLPTGLFVDSVTMVSSGVGADDNYVVGTPVTTVFSSPNGVDTISLDFNPSSIGESFTMDVDITILLNNGCEYTDNYQMTVDPRQIGNADTYDNILN